MYITKQEKFEGPLDLLLELIQGEKLSINEISLARVTDEFIGHLKALDMAGESDRELLAEFLVIAVELLLIKSRSLLPQFAVTPEEQESIAELTERLREYQRLKEIAHALGRMAAGGPKSFSREAYAGREPAFHPPQRFPLAALATAFRNAIAALPNVEKLAEEKIRKIISLEEKVKELQSFLQERVERAFSELVAGAKEKIEIIVSFLAILELAKQKLVALEQKEAFGDIKIRKAA